MATLAAEIADDWKDFDGLETVTLFQIRPNGTNQVSLTYTDDDGVTQPAALRRQASRSDRAAFGGLELTGEEVIWELPVSVVGSLGVRPGDKVRDGDDILWRIRVAQKATLGTRWRCICTKQE